MSVELVILDRTSMVNKQIISDLDLLVEFSQPIGWGFFTL